MCVEVAYTPYKQHLKYSLIFFRKEGEGPNYRTSINAPWAWTTGQGLAGGQGARESNGEIGKTVLGQKQKKLLNVN